MKQLSSVSYSPEISGLNRVVVVAVVAVAVVAVAAVLIEPLSQSE